jgi:hypothetical protein
LPIATKLYPALFDLNTAIKVAITLATRASNKQALYSP